MGLPDMDDRTTGRTLQDLKLKWVGDLSLQDAHLLHHYVLKTQGTILEFGVGGSTHIIAQTKSKTRDLLSIDTSPEWIDLTRKVLQKLNCTKYMFASWEQWVNRSALNALGIDLIFNDGYVDLREPFGIDSWPLLTPGGYLIFHDTRHISIIKNVTCLIERFHNEIEEVKFNEKWLGVASNLTVICKKMNEPYINWNFAENKPAWRYGHPEAGQVPDSYWDS